MKKDKAGITINSQTSIDYKFDPLPDTIKLLNDRFGAGLDENDRVFIQEQFDLLFQSDDIQALVLELSFEDFWQCLNDRIRTLLIRLAALNGKIYKLVMEDEESFMTIKKAVSKLFTLRMNDLNWEFEQSSPIESGKTWDN
ncbi:MAG: hypothetical protein GY940_43685 [bacterium]|nr:hypothetical protein [bacterium]